MQKISLITNSLNSSKRVNIDEKIVIKENNSLEITFLRDDNLGKIEEELNNLDKNRKILKKIKTFFNKIIVPSISVFVLLFMLLALAIFEDFFKKIIFQTPFEFTINDLISLFFVIIFILVLTFMPSLMNIERTEFKNFISSMFNKKFAKLQRFRALLSSLDNKTTINIYNFDIYDENNEIYEVFFKALSLKFNTINLYIRENNQEKIIVF